MRNKVLPLLIAIIVFFVPFGSTFANQNDLISGRTLVNDINSLDSNDANENPLNRMTDDDSSTYNVMSNRGAEYRLYIKFAEPVNVSSILMDVMSTKSDIRLDSYTLTTNNSYLQSNLPKANVRGTITQNINKTGVNQIRLDFNYNYAADTTGLIYLYDLKILSSDTIAKTEVTSVEIQAVSKDSGEVVWVNPTGYTGVSFTGAKIYLDDVLKSTESPTSTSYRFTDLSPNTNYSVRVAASYSYGSQTPGVTKTFKTNEVGNIKDLTDIVEHNFVKFLWEKPDDIDYSGLKIFRDDVLLTTTDGSATTYTDKTVSNSTNYTYKFIAFDSKGFEATEITRSVTTSELPPVKNIQEVKVSTTYNRVNLSWSLPNQEGLKHVNIYRKKIEEEPGFFESMFSLSGTKVYAADSNKIFETNGTYFNDLTVVPNSEYEYTLTTQTDDERESEGVTVVAETKEEPVPVIKEPGSTVNPSGDYVVTWSEPTKGKVKVLLDGTNYKTVDASLKQLVIPKNDMKYNILGEPKITLIPVGEYGTEGSKTFLNGGVVSSLKLPFDVNDLLQTIMGIIGLFGPFILLTLVIYYFKPIKNLIVRAAHRIRNGDVKNE
jgi:hypothetical protein